MQQLLVESEDIELEDSDSNANVVVDKYFNFDMLASVIPSITRIKPPNFNDLVKVPVNSSIDRQYVDKTFYKKSNPAESVMLPHKWQYYYCGCIEYDKTLPTVECPINPCTVEPIKSSAQIYVITIFLSKRLGHTASQRWNKNCWERLQHSLQVSWLDYKQAKEHLAAEEYFSLHSVINDQGEQVAEPAKTRGRHKSTEVLALSSEDGVKRSKLIQKYASYRGRYRKLKAQNKSTSSIENLINNIIDEVSNLGGTPTGWVRYENN